MQMLESNCGFEDAKDRYNQQLTGESKNEKNKEMEILGGRVNLDVVCACRMPRCL